MTVTETSSHASRATGTDHRPPGRRDQAGCTACRRACVHPTGDRLRRASCWQSVRSRRAFGDRFSDDDWAHALGGTHVLGVEGGSVVAHAVGGAPSARGGRRAPVCDGVRRGRGDAPRPGRARASGPLVMTEAAAVVRRTYALGALSTSRHSFYERLGWERWLGPTYVRDGDGLRAHRGGGRRRDGPPLQSTRRGGPHGVTHLRIPVRRRLVT